MKRPVQPVWLLQVIACVLAQLSVSPVRGDAGPKPKNDVVVSVTYQGRPLADANFKATLMEIAETARRPLTDADGRQWARANYQWGGDGRNGQVRFDGFSPRQRMDPGGAWPPKQVRLVIDLPSKGSFVTDVAETRPYLTLLRADLHPDGTGSLTRDLESLWQRLDMPYALGLTLLVELSIVAAYGRYKRAPHKRLLVLCVIVNVLSLPVVWFVTLECYSELGQWRGFGCLVLAELGAAVFEGLAYAWLGRLGLRSGLWLSLLANSASLLMGLIL
jgi:hypothetical protein